MIEFDLMYHFKRLCKKIYHFDFVVDDPKQFSRSFEQFQKMYLCLSQKNGFDRLFGRFFTNKELDDNIKDFVAEMVIAYSIASKAPKAKISYEPNCDIKGNNRPPDLKINFETKTVYIQIKRMAKSISYQTNLTEYGDNGMMIAFDDINQIVGALNKATRFIPKNNDDIFIIAQLIPDNIPSSNIEFAEALYGREITLINPITKEIILQRINVDVNNCKQDGGFFYSENGKKVDAYIKATETNGIFYPYNFEMFLNNQKTSDKSPIYDLIDISATYDSKTYFT